MTTLADITAAVAAHYAVPRRALLGKDDPKRLARPRHVAMWLARRHLRKGTPWIGHYLKRDQSTVRYGIQRIEDALPRDVALRGAVEMIEERLAL